jgi:hypothetical protein
MYRARDRHHRSRGHCSNFRRMDARKGASIETESTLVDWTIPAVGKAREQFSSLLNALATTS